MFKFALEYTNPSVDRAPVADCFRSHLWEVCYQMELKGRFVIGLGELAGELDGYGLADLVMPIPEVIDDLVAGDATELLSYTQGYVVKLRFAPTGDVVQTSLTVNDQRTDAVPERRFVVSELLSGFRQIVEYLSLDADLIERRAYRYWLGIPALVDAGIGSKVFREKSDYEFAYWLEQRPSFNSIDESSPSTNNTPRPWSIGS